jgi:hypothetical protein
MRPTLTSRRKPWRGGTFLCFASTSRLCRTRQSTESADCVDALGMSPAYPGRAKKSRAGQVRSGPPMQPVELNGFGATGPLVAGSDRPPAIVRRGGPGRPTMRSRVEG